MHKSIYWVVAVWLLIAFFLMMDKPRAETTYYQNKNGNQVGSSYTMGNQTFYQSNNGAPVGSSYTMGNYTVYQAPDGKQIGTSYTMPNGQPQGQQPSGNPFFGDQQR